MIQYIKDWFKRPFDENAKNYARDYAKNRLRVIFSMFIIVVLLIIVLELDKKFNISEFLGIPCEYIYSLEKCSK